MRNGTQAEHGEEDEAQGERGERGRALRLGNGRYEARSEERADAEAEDDREQMPPARSSSGRTLSGRRSAGSAVSARIARADR